ncbi:MAG TPA: response regulator transcription factor [Candidatus Limnocylindrales bacterium]|nr:response regulator transcription factor [Candidatus Limnocylindrales bacterium]
MTGNGMTAGTGERLRVLLAILDFPLVNAGLRAAIEAEPDMAVVGTATTHAALRELVATVPADVIVTECLPVSRDGCAAFQAIEAIRAGAPAMKILALECRSGSEQFSLALRAGADGFLTREAEPADVVTALRHIRRGETYVSPALVTKMVNTYVLRSPEHSLEDAYDTLSDREREVLLLAAVGHTNREMAKALHLSEQTVHNYRASVMEKLGFHDRVELLKYAIRRGVLNVADL